MFGLMAGDPEGRVAGTKEFPVAPAVPLEGDCGAVEVAAVGLDHEVLVRPEEVHLDPAVGDLDWCVEERRGEIAPEEQRQDLRLEWALEAPFPRHRSGLPPGIDERPQGPDAASSRIHRSLD